MCRGGMDGAGNTDAPWRHRTPSAGSLRRLASETSTPPPTPYVPGSNDSYGSPNSTTRTMAVFTRPNPRCPGSMHAIGRFSDLGVSVSATIGTRVVLAPALGHRVVDTNSRRGGMANSTPVAHWEDTKRHSLSSSYGECTTPSHGPHG